MAEKAARKPASPRKPAPPKTAEPKAESTQPSVVMRRKDLVERVAAASGARKNQVKPVVEALLAELGDALSRGEVLNLPPLGKLSVNRSKDAGNGEVLVCKLRRPGPGAKGSKETLATEDEDS